MAITAHSDPCLTKRPTIPGCGVQSLNGTLVRRQICPQVFLTTLDFLDSVLVSIGACKEARHNHVVAALEPTVATLLNKLGDGQARLRDGAMNGLVAVARCRTAGPTFVR